MILVARAQTDAPHQGMVYDIGLRDLLPLDVAALFCEVYIAARYRLPPLDSDDRAWIERQFGDRSTY